MASRVVITGFGCLTACGADAQATWASVTSGKTGIAQIADPQTADWPYPLAGEIKNYRPRDLISDRKLLKAIGRQDVLGLNAAAQALDHSGLLDYRDSLGDSDRVNERTGVFVGSPASKYAQRYDYLAPLAATDGDQKQFGNAAMEQVHPMWLLRTLPNNVLAYVGIQYGLKGANQNFTDHGVSGTQAIAEASRYISDGDIDRAIVVGYDCASEPEAVVYYAAMGLLSSRGVKSFDAARDGTVLGEGAGALVLESLDAARERGATVYGEILGSGVVSEAQGILSILEDGDGLSRSIRLALEQARTPIEVIGMVTAHANGTRASDASEALALSEFFSELPVPVTGFKWSLGHTVAASGVIETILTLFCLREGRVPGIPTLKNPAHECQGLNVSANENTPRSSTGLVLSRGFAGLNSCLAISGDVG
jgi:3-oxoacyl-[acyl-carrier-protein] synthase-1